MTFPVCFISFHFFYTNDFKEQVKDFFSRQSLTFFSLTVDDFSMFDNVQSEMCCNYAMMTDLFVQSF